MAAHRSYRGVNVDHLYPDCPACPQPAKLQAGWVDPEGTDICGLCLARWRRLLTSIIGDSTNQENNDE